MARPGILDRLVQQHIELNRQSLVRRLRLVEQRDGVRVRVKGVELLNFCSNDYLGLADHVEIIGALQESAAHHGLGATASHLVSGHHREHQALEDAVEEWLGYPRALCFGSGYLANLAVIQSLLGRDDICVADKPNHASLLDAVELAGCEHKRYPHADFEGALRQLRSRPDALAMIATDGVFSMDGDMAPLKMLALLARAENATLYVDDAHGAGVIGPNGRGSAAYCGLGPREVALNLVTLGKAFGGYGAVLAGSTELIEGVLQNARAYRYTTALPPALAVAGRVAIGVAQKESWRRFKLTALVSRFRRGAQQLGLPLMESLTPVQPLLVGGNSAALYAARELEKRGILVTAIRPPTVPEGRARLRVALSAAHSEGDVDRLLSALGEVCQRLPHDAEKA